MPRISRQSAQEAAFTPRCAHGTHIVRGSINPRAIDLPERLSMKNMVFLPISLHFCQTE
jgi:hypothetical protein